MSERSFHRDLIFSTWHRMIPNVRGIDLDLAQMPKNSNVPEIIFETKIKQNAEIIERGPEWRVGRAITQTIAERVGSKGALVVYHPRYPQNGFDDIHSKLLRRFHELNKEVQRLSLEQMNTLNYIIQYCYKNHGVTGAYNSFIDQMGLMYIQPYRPDKYIRSSTEPLKNLLIEHYANIEENRHDNREIILPSSKNGLSLDEYLKAINTGKTSNGQLSFLGEL